MFSNTFNTTQFVDVSNDRQRNSGNTIYRDLNNPGDYYLETSAGTVYRINRQISITNIDGNFVEEQDQTQYCINPRTLYRGKNKSLGYTPIMNRNQRLARIQYVSNRRARKRADVTATFVPKTGQLITYIPG